ncbi:MAG: rhodanese-like domain-containing protein [Gammaproteobacteria bacterium]|nr:MAG: rhodanese-like domain-containing protein [Gammaproteobacteria bacterium]
MKTYGDLIREARARIREWDPETLEEMRASRPDLLIVDVREPEEYKQGHIPGALLIPRGTLECAADPSYKRRVEPLCHAQERPVVLYCESGGRSALAAATLQEMGFKEVYHLAGGLDLWEAEDLPVERG